MKTTSIQAGKKKRKRSKGKVHVESENERNPSGSDDDDLDDSDGQSEEDTVSDNSTHDGDMFDETVVYWQPKPEEIKKHCFVAWGGGCDGKEEVWMGRVLADMTRSGRVKHRIHVTYQRRIPIKDGWEWIDAVAEGSRIMWKDCVDYEQVDAKIMFGKRKDDKRITSHKVFRDLDNKLTLIYAAG